MPSLGIHGLLGGRKRFVDLEVQLHVPVQTNLALTLQASQELYCPVIPGLPDDVAKFCLTLVPRRDLPVIGAVCKRWMSFIKSKEFLAVRKEAGKLEEWVYVLTGDADGRENHWEVLVGSGEKGKVLPSMPGPVKAGFGVVVIDAILFIIAGYSVDIGKACVSNDVYQYDSRLNRWSTLAKMNVARHDFACAELNGNIYAVGGFDSNGDCLSSVEVYDPNRNMWTLIASLRCPRWGCFACSFEGKLYVMGGRSSFTIGNSRFVNVYNPQHQSWCEMKSGCLMVTAHAVLAKKLFCFEWKNQRKLAIYDPVDNSWRKIPVPVTGSSAVAFRFGIFDGKLLLFSLEKVPGYQTLLYDPDAPVGSEWKTSSLKPSGLCLCSVTIKA
ncbi:F-box/kelch-repeat protein At1g67480-like [Musa acuminata AAA Group]|uniref:F-box/kelch-repeat protein At1g67480-like n=1 Tax=Musa acuminata AAA Group TaxID=214697 RepID=UPI0031D658D8